MKEFVFVVLGVSVLLPSHADADEILESSFYAPSMYPNPDPLFQKLGDYVYYAQGQGMNGLNAKAASFVTSPQHAVITEIRIAQDTQLPMGGVSLWASSNGEPAIKLGGSSSPTVHLSGPNAIIASWDLSAQNIVLEPSSAYWISFDAPMTFYRGVGFFGAGQLPSGQWTQIGFESGAWELRGNIIPTPSSLALLGFAGIAAMRRKRTHC